MNISFKKLHKENLKSNHTMVNLKQLYHLELIYEFIIMF